MWQGRLSSLEARLSAAAAPPPELLTAVEGIERQLASVEHRMHLAEQTAQELQRCTTLPATVSIVASMLLLGAVGNMLGPLA